MKRYDFLVNLNRCNSYHFGDCGSTSSGERTSSPSELRGGCVIVWSGPLCSLSSSIWLRGKAHSFPPHLYSVLRAESKWGISQYLLLFLLTFVYHVILNTFYDHVESHQQDQREDHFVPWWQRREPSGRTTVHHSTSSRCTFHLSSPSIAHSFSYD